MNIRNKVIACIFAVALLSQANVRAEEAIQVTTTVQKQVIVEKDDGTKETRLVAADSVVPGERVVYTISFRNTGSEPAENVVITNPIARTLTYVAGSAAGKNLEVEFSVDGGANFAPATELKVADNGVERPATTPDYTHVRWVMRSELAAGGQGQATFAAVLE
jgi:uncharacterized repeat protein (TIGR01451 family)